MQNNTINAQNATISFENSTDSQAKDAKLADIPVLLCEDSYLPNKLAARSTVPVSIPAEIIQDILCRIMRTPTFLPIPLMPISPQRYLFCHLARSCNAHCCANHGPVSLSPCFIGFISLTQLSRGWRIQHCLIFLKNVMVNAQGSVC